jgi:hypothetical protein
MIERVKPSSRHAKHYADRGITVCARWGVYENFLADMGRRPSPEHSLDRIDNDRGYEPGNCRWATDVEQNRNTRGNHLVTFRGETLPIAAWAERLGMLHATLTYRLRTWSVERAFTEPFHANAGWRKPKRGGL